MISSVQRLFRLPLIALIVIGLALAASPVAAAPGQGAGAEARRADSDPRLRPSVVVLLDGLCSSHGSAGVPGAFAGTDRLAARLLAAGWTADQLLAYSYVGGTVDEAGRWVPRPYDCEDTRRQAIPAAVATLDAQIHDWLARHPGSDVHLVGYSLGGVIAFAYLAHLERGGAGSFPNGGRLASVVSLDSPIGGLPFVDAACGLVGNVCAAARPGPTPAPLADLATVWKAGSGRPAGSTRSLGRLFGLAHTNQALAEAAAARGVAVLSLGNVRDWIYAPIGLFRDTVNFVDTQWLRSGAVGSGVYARAIDSGPSTCPSSDASGAGCNHGLVLTDPAALAAIVATLSGRAPAAAVTCAAGRGGCVALQPRPIAPVTSAIAPRIVTTGTAGFATGAARVARGTRVTVLFRSVPGLAGSRVEIWARSRTGAYRFLTSRIADATGTVRYHAPPVTAWVAYQARYQGTLSLGPSVSPGRVADVR